MEICALELLVGCLGAFTVLRKRVETVVEKHS